MWISHQTSFDGHRPFWSLCFTKGCSDSGINSACSLQLTQSGGHCYQLVGISRRQKTLESQCFVVVKQQLKILLSVKMARFKAAHPSSDEQFKYNDGENCINQPQVGIASTLTHLLILWRPVLSSCILLAVFIYTPYPIRRHKELY